LVRGLYVVRGLFINWIKFPDFYHCVDQIPPRHAKKLGAAPLIVIIGGCDRCHISQFEIYFTVSEKKPWLNLRRSVPLRHAGVGEFG